MKPDAYYHALIQDLTNLQAQVATHFPANERMRVQNALGQIIILAQRQLNELNDEH